MSVRIFIKLALSAGNMACHRMLASQGTRVIWLQQLPQMFDDLRSKSQLPAA